MAVKGPAGLLSQALHGSQLLLSPGSHNADTSVLSGVEKLRGKDVIVNQLQQQLAGCGWNAKDAAPLCWLNSGTLKLTLMGLPLSSLCASACFAACRQQPWAGSVSLPLVLVGGLTVSPAGPDIPPWPPHGKDAHGCKVHMLEGGAWWVGCFILTSQCCSKLLCTIDGGPSRC